MKKLITSLLLLSVTFASAAFAADASGQEGSFLLILFLGFFALIIVFQLVPAVLLFAGMLKGLFSREPMEVEERIKN